MKKKMQKKKKGVGKWGFHESRPNAQGRIQRPAAIAAGLKNL